MSYPGNANYIYMSASTTATAKQVVAGVTNYRLRVYGGLVHMAGANTVTIQSSTGGVYLGPYTLAAAGTFALPPAMLGYAETAASRGLYMQLENAAAANVNFTYGIVTT